MKPTNISYILRVINLLPVLVWLGCNTRGSLPIGSHAATDSHLAPKGTEFESGRYARAIEIVDSNFHQISKPTVYDYIGYYGTYAYVNGVFNNPYTQLVYLDSAIDLLRDYENDPGLADELSGFLMSRGDVLFNVKKYSASYEDFFEAIRISHEHPDVCRKMKVPYSIAMILYRQQQFGNSGKYFIESLQYIDSCETNIAYRNNKKQEVLDNIGLCYTKQKKYDSAMYYYQQALALVKANPYRMAVDSINSFVRYAAASGVISGNMAKVYLGKGNIDSAIALYQRAIKLNAEHGKDLHDMQLCMVQLSEIYLAQNMLGPLRETLQSLGGSLDSVNAGDIRMEYSRLMYDYYDRNHQSEKALGYLKDYLFKKDSVAELQKQLMQTDITKELKDRQQQFEITLLQKDNQLNKTYLAVLVGLSVLVIIILGLIYQMYRSSRKNVKRLTELNTEISGRRQSLEQALKRLENANLEKDRIMRVVAHDLRNPIGGIVTLSNMMLTGDMVNERSKPIVDAISSASTSSIGMIEELLHTGYADIHEVEKTETDIGDLLENVVNLQQLKAEAKNQRIYLELPSEKFTMMIHPGQLERVLNNLLVNAIKFSPHATDITISLTKENDKTEIAVKDNGIGIPAQILPYIFDGSGIVKRIGTAGEKSFGLGLSICRQIVEAMGGTIRVESEEGTGTVFYIAFPGK